MSKNLIISFFILTLILIMSVSILGKRNKNIVPVGTIVSSGSSTIANNTREDITRVQIESSFDCTTFTTPSDRIHCGEDTKIINEALVLGDVRKCENLSNVPRKESCKEQIVTRKAAKSGKASECDVLSSTGARESCRANMSYWKVIESTIITQ